MQTPDTILGMTIENKDNVLALTLTPVVVKMQATRALKEKLEQERAGDADLERSGLAGRFARFIVGGVERLLEQTIAYDLSDIKSASYDGEKIVFSYHNKHLLSFEEIRVKNESALASFSEEDARKFVAAVNEQKTATGRFG